MHEKSSVSLYYVDIHAEKTPYVSAFVWGSIGNELVHQTYENDS